MEAVDYRGIETMADMTTDTKGIKRKRKFVGCSPLEHFEVGEKVGVGTFGEVVKAKHSGNSKTVALKKIFIRAEQEGFPITSLREIKLLKNVNHPNVVNLVDMCASSKPSANANGPDEISEIFMVFPYMDHDLVGLLENQKVHLTVPVIKCYFRQVLLGLEYLHQNNIMHRDMKGANLLINNRGELKITDFGLARPLEENRVKYTPGVVTRWYRPPELLFGSTHYNQSIDIWGAGCILAEMYLHKPLFGGATDLEQIEMVIRICGTPTEDNLPGVSSFPDFGKIKLQSYRRCLVEHLLEKRVDPEAADLIDKLLALDPKKRLTASEALKHPYFTTEPLPCQPSEIPTFESSHEYTIQKNTARPHMTPRQHGEFKSSRDAIDEFGASSTLPPPPPPSSHRGSSSRHSSISPRRRGHHDHESERRHHHHSSDRHHDHHSHHRSSERERYHDHDRHHHTESRSRHVEGRSHHDNYHGEAHSHHHRHHEYRHHRSRSPPHHHHSERAVYHDLDRREGYREVKIERQEPKPPVGRKQVSYDDML